MPAAWLAALLLVSWVAPAAGQRHAPIGELIATLEDGIERARLEYGVPGVAAALVHGGTVVWERGFGVLRRGEEQPVEPDSVFQVASISKPVTAVGVLQLVNAGLLDLDRPVSSYLRRWSFPPSDFDVDLVTTRRLLNHTAGTNIHGYPGLPPRQALPSLAASLNGETGGAGAVTLELEPGRSTSYSSGGYSVLQLLIEELSETTFSTYMGERVLDPLGMSRSTFEGPVREGRASGHSWWGRPLPDYRFRAQAASGLLSSATDLARFLAALAHPPALGLSSALRDQLVEPASVRPSSFGLGFALERSEPTKVVLHTGANRGWRSLVAAAPDRGEGLVVLTNSDRGLPLTTDALCQWGKWLDDYELATCWADRKSRGTILAVAIILGLGVMLDGTSFAALAFSERRRKRLATRARYRWLGWARLVVSALVLGLWWLFWYSDVIVMRREGIGDFTPVASLPPTFVWLTVVVTCWCLLSIARSVIGRQSLRAPGVEGS